MSNKTISLQRNIFNISAGLIVNDLDNTHLQFWYGLKIGGNFVGSGVSGGYVYLF